MLRNPFKYGKEVSGEAFYDRREVSETLYRRLADGSSNVVMYAPRRYGKTSLVKKVLARFAAEGVRTIYFDMNRAESIERFCEEYASAVYSLCGKTTALLDAFGRYLSHLHPTLGFGGDQPVSVRFDYGEKMTATSVSEVLDLVERIAVESKTGPIIVAFDEFQEVARLSPSLPLEGIFRSCIQAHQNVNYVFFGSKTHLLRRMFGDHARPFYRSASVLKLDKPPEAESLAFVRDRFAARGVGIDEAVAGELVRKAENIPYYIQQLGYFAFDAVVADEKDRLEKRHLDQAVDALLANDADYFSERLGAFSPSQRSLIAALAAEPVAEFVESYRRRHGLGVSATVHAALRVIVEAGVVEREGETYSLGDPFFARYVRMRPFEAVGTDGHLL